MPRAVGTGHWARSAARLNPRWRSSRLDRTANFERARIHYFRGWEHMRAEAFDVAASEFGAGDRALSEVRDGALQPGPRLHGAAPVPRRHSRAQLRAARSYSAEASKVFNSQLDANRQRQDRLMELQDIRIAGVEGPAERRHAGHHAPDRQCDQDDQQRVRSRTERAMENPVPSFVSLSLGSAYFRAEQFDRSRAAVPRRDQRRCEGRRSPQQSGHRPDDESAVHRRDGRAEGGGEGGVSRQSGAEGSDQEPDGTVRTRGRRAQGRREGRKERSGLMDVA